MKATWLSIVLLMATLLLAGCNIFMDDVKIASEDTTSTETETETVTDSDSDRIIDSGTNTGTDSDTVPVKSSCEDVRCGNPDTAQCDGVTALQIFAAAGYCVNGGCEYAHRSETCESGECARGICLENPCQGVTCSTPPAPVCEGNSLRMYSERGHCAENGITPQCEYSSVLLECVNGCRNNACILEPCKGVRCDTPPARYCDSGVLHVFDTLGQCTEGECAYAVQEVQCASGCGAGRCEGDDACRFVTCLDSPANYCVSDSTLRIFNTRGSCESGACYYGHEDVVCTNGCQNGQCLGEPCTGVTCDLPPSSRCADDITLQVWDGIDGVCVDGVCNYQTQNVSCPGQCAQGRCESSICTGVICNSGYAEYCRAGSLVSWDTPGSCGASGACEYSESLRECSDICTHGSCTVVRDTTMSISSSYAVNAGNGLVSCDHYKGWISAGQTPVTGSARSENYILQLGVSGGSLK